MICGSMEINQGASHMVYGIQDNHEVGEGGEGLMFPTESYWQLPSMHDDHHIDPIQHQPSFFASLSSLPAPHHPPPTSSLFTSLQFPYNRGDPNPYMASEGYFQARGLPSSSSPFVGLHAEFGRMTAQEFMDAKALAASKSHSEAERRRRERINAHLAKLRSMLPGTTKTDKASLLAEVIQHVKELKRQTSSMAEDGHSPLPTEFDELTIDSSNDEHGRRLVRAQLCCDDRSDLFPDLIKALKSLRLRTLKAEITTLAGRVKNVIVVTGEDDPACPSIASIQDALKAVMERQAHADESTSSGGTKRQRTNHLGGKHEGRATI